MVRARTGLDQGMYKVPQLIAMFRIAAKLRNKMLEADFTDNGGAIHSAERILDILGQRLKYPGMSHITALKGHAKARFSVAACRAYRRRQSLKIEHVSPLRHLTRLAIDYSRGRTNAQLRNYVRRHYQLALITPREMERLNGINRIRRSRDRLRSAGIVLAKSRPPVQD